MKKLDCLTSVSKCSFVTIKLPVNHSNEEIHTFNMILISIFNFRMFLYFEKKYLESLRRNDKIEDYFPSLIVDYLRKVNKLYLVENRVRLIINFNQLFMKYFQGNNSGSSRNRRKYDSKCRNYTTSYRF